MSLSLIIGIIVAVLIILAFVFCAIYGLRSRMYGVSIGFLALALILLIVAGMINNIGSAAKLKQAVDSNYTFYIDGTKIDVENIDLKLYQRYTIDDNQNTVYISTAH